MIAHGPAIPYALIAPLIDRAGLRAIDVRSILIEPAGVTFEVLERTPTDGIVAVTGDDGETYPATRNMVCPVTGHYL